MWFAILAPGQISTGSIEGLVLDPEGKPLPNAIVTVAEPDTGRTLIFATNTAGRYSAGALMPGSYRVRIESPGYQTVEILDLNMDAGATIRGDAALTRGDTLFTVSVYTQQDTVQALRHTVDTVITAKEIRNYPLVGRNFLDLAVLAPGVSVGGAGALDPTKSSVAYRRVGMAGRLGTGTRTQVDGIDITDPVAGGTVLNISPESVHEFQLSQSSLDPATPLTSTGAIQITTKAGSNALHGTGFWNFYNQDMAARANYESQSLPFGRKQGGGSLGGRLIRDKLFFSAAGEQTWFEVLNFSRSVQFPQLNVTSALPSPFRSMNGRLDWVVSPSVRVFGSYLNDWNSTAVGQLSPTQNKNWSSAVIAGVDAVRPAWSHSYRFGFTNYNNRLDTLERGIPFHRTPQGTPFYLGVGTYQVGPNSQAPQATGESSWQNAYNGAWLRGRHSVRFGGSLNRLVTGGTFTSGRPTVTGLFDNTTVQQVLARGADPTNPLEFPLTSFTLPAGKGYPFLAAGRGFPYGAHYDTRSLLYVVDSIRLQRLTLTAGLRWNYGSGYLPNDRRVPRDPDFERWIAGGSQFPEPPKRMFSPHFGFALDPWGKGATVVRGGFSLAYENVIQNVAMFDETALLPSDLGGTSYSHRFVAGPSGAPINADGLHPRGDYSDLLGRSIKDVIGTIGQVQTALQAAYAAYRPEPGREVSAFQATRGGVGTFFPGNQFKVPYSLQFNFGVQHQLRKSTVVTVDYIRNRGVGLPGLTPDLERNRDAAFLNRSAAVTQVNRVLAGRTMDQWFAVNPRGTISNFGVFTDTVWPGVSPEYLYAGFNMGGFSLYRALNLTVRGSAKGQRGFSDPFWLVNYAFSRSEASNASSNPEFGVTASDNRNWNNPTWFGPTGLDVTHRFNALFVFTAPGGIRLSTHTVFRTPTPLNLFLPAVGTVGGAQGFAFGTDLNGDGRQDLVPGIGAGQVGRGVGVLSSLNRSLTAYNENQAGRLTPHGQALVAAGIFTEEQMRRLGAVTPTIPLVPASNPVPWRNVLNTNIRLQRPFRIERAGKVWQAGPYLDILNLFNHAPANTLYSGLTGVFGSFNFDYRNAPAGQQISNLQATRGRSAGTRLIQFGLRLDF